MLSLSVGSDAMRVHWNKGVCTRTGSPSIPIRFIYLVLLHNTSESQKHLSIVSASVVKSLHSLAGSNFRGPPKQKQVLMVTSVSSEAQQGKSPLLRSLWEVGTIQFLLWLDCSSWLSLCPSSPSVLGGSSMFFVLWGFPIRHKGRKERQER